MGLEHERFAVLGLIFVLIEAETERGRDTRASLNTITPLVWYKDQTSASQKQGTALHSELPLQFQELLLFILPIQSSPDYHLFSSKPEST